MPSAVLGMTAAQGVVRPRVSHPFDQPPCLEHNEKRNSDCILEPRSCDDNAGLLDCPVETRTLAVPPPEHRPSVRGYGERWDWDQDEQDYVRVGKDGLKLLYTDYQRAGNRALSPLPPDEPQLNQDAQVKKTLPEPSTDSVPRTIQPPAPKRPAYEEPLGDDFQVVAKPKRFFTPGRVFQTVWFEPAATPDAAKRQPGESWASRCEPPFHGVRPAARFRYFVVVRRRPHHSLCFGITTFGGGKGVAKSNRGLPEDYVVLYNANIDPAEPHEQEDITRKPMAVIIEDGEQYIAPTARLDCGRIYTVEHHLQVAKIGRVHPQWLDDLEGYYRQSVLRL